MTTMVKLAAGVAALAFFFAFMAAWNRWLAPEPSADGAGLVVFGAGLAVGVLCLGLSLRIEPVHTAHILATGFAILSIVAPLLWLAKEPTPVAGPVSAASFVACASVLGWGRWLERPNPAAPDFLTDLYGRRSYYESNGVQFVCLAPKGLRPGEKGLLQVHVQNAFDAARSVTVHLEMPNLLVPANREIEVKPLEVGVLRVPFIVAKNLGSREKELLFSLSATGPSGRRWRRARGITAPVRTSQLELALGFALGHVSWNSGLFFRVQVEAGEAPPPPSIDAISWESDWLPSPSS